MTEGCRQGSLREIAKTFVFVSFAVFAIQAAFANPLQITAKVDEKYSDNVSLQNDNPRSDLEHSVGLSLKHQSDPGICNSLLSLDLGFTHYQRHTYGDQTQTIGHWNGNCQLRGGFSWLARDNINQVTINKTQASTPNNQTRRNFFSTGPQYVWLVSPRDKVSTTVFFQKTNYSGGVLSNARHYVGSSTYTHQLDSSFSLGLGGRIDRGELDNGQNIVSRSGNIQFQKNFATTLATGSFGYSKLTDTNNGFTTHNSGAVWSLRLDRQLNYASSWYLDYGRELTDTTSQTAITIAGLNFNLAQTTAVRVTHWQTGIKKKFLGGGTVNISAGQQVSAYLQSGYTEKSTNASAIFSEPVSDILSASINIAASHDTYPEKSLIDNTYQGSVGLEYRRTRQLTFNVRLGRNQRAANIDANCYKENWIMAGALYRFE